VLLIGSIALGIVNSLQSVGKSEIVVYQTNPCLLALLIVERLCHVSKILAEVMGK